MKRKFNSIQFNSIQFNSIQFLSLSTIKVLLILFSNLLLVPFYYSQSFWENNPSLPQTYTNGTVSIGVSPGPINAKLRIQASGNVPYGQIIYNTSAISSGPKYGLLISLNNNSPSANNIGIYSETLYQGLNSWAGYFNGHGYFSGNLGVGIGSISQPNTERLAVWNGNMVIGSPYNKFVFHHQWWNPSSDFLSLAPWSSSLNNWDFSAAITLKNSGQVNMKNLEIAETLKVNQKIWAKEIEVKLPPFPDYVFNRDYPLISLDSLMVFIQQYGHLPGFISATEMDAMHGYNVAELLIKQMEKIEELTLYILELHRRIKVMQSMKKED